MSRFALVIEELKYIYINLKLVFIEMHIIWTNGVRKISKISSFKHLFRVHILTVTVFSIARWVYEPQYSVAEAPIIRVFNVDDGHFGFKVWWKLAVTPTR